MEIGFPGLSLGYLRPVTSTADLSVRLDGNYAYEGIFSTLTLFGGHAEASLRIRLLEIAGISVGVQAGAGVFTYFPIGQLVIGLVLPLGARIGVPLGPTLSAFAGVDLPMWITFGSAASGFTVPVLGTAGLEYFIDRNMAATLRARAGPALNPSGFRFGGPSVPELGIQAGIELRLQ